MARVPGRYRRADLGGVEMSGERRFRRLREMPSKTRDYIHGYRLQRQQSDGWTEMEQALVLTLVEWQTECSLRPSFGEGSDCSDLMDEALARLLGLASGELTPAQVLADVYTSDDEATR